MEERPRARDLMLAYQRADADRRAIAAQPGYRRTAEAAHEASARAAAAHQAWQAELTSGGTEAGS
jgi:hypothetical protein